MNDSEEEMEGGEHGSDEEEEAEEEEEEEEYDGPPGDVTFTLVDQTKKADEAAAASAASAAAGAAAAAARRAEAANAAAAAAAVAAAAAASANAAPSSPRAKPLSPFLQDAKEKLVRIMISQITNINANSPPMQEGCIVTMHKLCCNVLENPGEAKFRKVRANNAMVKGKVSVCRGGEEFLIAAGWRRRVDNFEPYFVFEAGGGGGGGDGDGGGGDGGGGSGGGGGNGSALLMEVLKLAEEVLSKNLSLAREKTERYERQKLMEKHDAAMRKEETMRAIKEDKELRKLKQEAKATTTTTTTQ